MRQRRAILLQLLKLMAVQLDILIVKLHSVAVAAVRVEVEAELVDRETKLLQGVERSLAQLLRVLLTGKWQVEAGEQRPPDDGTAGLVALRILQLERDIRIGQRRAGRADCPARWRRSRRPSPAPRIS